MIPYSRETQAPLAASAVKIIGLGGAGSNMLERIALDGIDSAELLALNTDLRTLNASISREKIQLGSNLTKGLGAGGDPELGQNAMIEAENSVRNALKGRRIVFLCTGLGGGTGSGAAPIVTRIAREEGAFVVVFATMPFAFEGRRRREQADTALNELAVLANALVTFDNNRMGELVLAKQGVHEAFNAADRMICESIKAVIRLVARPGLINVGLDDLVTALRTTRSRCLFGSGMAEGKDRAARALRNALSSPLLDQGSLLADAQSVLVHLSGGESLTLYEIELLMQELQKHVPEKAHVLFGAAIDPAMGDQLSITLISALPEDALANAPRESLTRANAEESSSALEPTQGYTPEPKPKKSAPADEPKPESKAEPKPDPNPDPAPPAKPTADDDERPFAEPPRPPAPVDETLPLLDPAPAPESETPPAEKPAEQSKDKPLKTTAAVSVKAPAPAPDAPATRKTILPPRRESPRKTPEVPAEEDVLEDPDDLKTPATSGKTEDQAETPTAKQQSNDSGEDDDDDNIPAPRLSLNVKPDKSQSELTFDSVPRGRFQGESPNVVDGEDLDLPPFLRKKKE